MTDVRVDLKEFTVAVLDGYCQGLGICRNKLINEILGDWAYQEHHKSRLVIRVAGDKPDVADDRRR
jgi:hypothetical protein